MDQPDSTVCFIDMLTPGSARTESLIFQIFGIDIDVHIL